MGITSDDRVAALLEDLERRRRRLAERFARTRSVAERFAISRELGRLLESRRTLLAQSAL